MDFNFVLLCILGVLLNIFLAHLNGKVGESRKIGYEISFLVSFILSPLIGLIVSLSSEKIQDQEVLNNFGKKTMTKDTDNNDFTRLINLKDKGILSDEEYIVKCKQLYNREYNTEFLSSSTYSELKSLNDNELLTDLEFEIKITSLKNSKQLQSSEEITEYLQKKYTKSHQNETSPNYVCSNCGYETILKREKCPSCGDKM